MEKFPVRKFAKTLAFSLLVFLFVTKPALAAEWGIGCKAKPEQTAGSGQTAGPADIATLQGLECVFSNTISVALALAGIVLFVMFLIGGFRFITSGGDQKAVEAARGTLTHAVLGLVVVLLAFLILQLIKTITGVDVTTFKVTQ